MLLLFDRFMNPLLLSGVAFGTYDWVLLGIILFAALIGVIRGFTKQLFDLCGFLVVLIASILLCKVVAKLLPDSSGAIFDKINGFLTEKVTQNGLEELWSAPQNWHSSPELVEQALEAFGLSKIFSCASRLLFSLFSSVRFIRNNEVSKAFLFFIFTELPPSLFSIFRI